MSDSTIPTTAPIPSRSASLSLRLMRPAIRGFGALSRRRRRPVPPPHPAVEYAYGSNPAERLDYLAPKEGAPRRAALIYFHGGGWVMGAKETYTPFLGFLAEAGHPVFNVGYPLAPENPHPGVLCSLFRAIDWIASSHPEVTDYYTMGDSAGGNLSAMVGLLAHHPELLEQVDPKRSRCLPLCCRGIVSLYGVLDRLSWIEDGFPGAEMMLESYASRAAFEREVAPGLAITPMDLPFDGAPPTLLVVGTEDPLLRSSRIFAERLGRSSAEVSLREYPGEPHGFFNFGKSDSAARLNEDILGFLTSGATSSD